jgi:ketosteroid isomerase-like protein
MAAPDFRLARTMRIARRAAVVLTLAALTAAGGGTRAQPAAAAPAAAQLPAVTLPPELARVLTDYETAWAAKDAKALAELFAEDGFVLSGGTPPVRGRANILKHYGNAGGTLSLRALAYATSGDVGYIIGGFSRAAGEADVGKFTLTLKKVPDGRWLIMSDMDNANARRP